MPPDLSEEIQRCEEQYAENPGSLVFARLADLYRKAGEPNRALGVLEDGLERHPDYLTAHIVRARCLRDLDREDEAEEAFRRVLDRDEQNLVALRSLAELARERGDSEGARRRYETLLELDPHNEEARSALEEMGAGEAVGPPPPERPPTPEPAGEAGPEDAGEPRVEEAGEPPGEETDEAGDELPWWQREEEGPASPSAEAVDTDETEGTEGGVAAGPGAGAADGGVEDGDVFSLAGEGREEAEPRDETGGGPEAASGEEAEFLGLDEGASSGEDAGAAEADDIPAEEKLKERIEEVAEPEDVEELAEAEDEDLLTETLAGLYETQGFYREAVEMYEELLEERPDDEELRSRLEAARSAMEDEPGAGPGETVSAADAASAEGVPGEAPEEPDAGEAAQEPEPTPRGSARAHLRALLRGEAAAGSGPDRPERAP